MAADAVSEFKPLTRKELRGWPTPTYHLVSRSALHYLARVEQVEAKLAEAFTFASGQQRELDAAEAREKQLADALAFYADPANYRWSEGPPRRRGVIQAQDKGARAREALASVSAGEPSEEHDDG